MFNRNLHLTGISTVLKSSGHVCESTGLDIFGAARCLSSAQSMSYYGVMGACSLQEIFKKEQSEPLFPASPETKYQFPRQGTLGEQLHYFTK